MRTLAEDPLRWSSHFKSGFLSAIPPRERISMPGEWERVIWTGGDATLLRVAAVDWNAKVYGMTDVGTVGPPLRIHLGEDPDDSSSRSVNSYAYCYLQPPSVIPGLASWSSMSLTTPTSRHGYDGALRALGLLAMASGF